MQGFTNPSQNISGLSWFVTSSSACEIMQILLIGRKSKMCCNFLNKILGMIAVFCTSSLKIFFFFFFCIIL